MPKKKQESTATPHPARPLVLIPTATLVPNARNARTHSKAQIKEIAESIHRFGFTNPVLLDGATGIVAGHGRVLAAQLRGLEEVPCIRLGDLTDEQRRAYALADNKLALNSGWDDKLLAEEMEAIRAADADLAASLGFNAEEMEAILRGGNSGLTDPDDVPPAPKNPVTRLGDRWILGDHAITCGDCTDAAVVAVAMAGQVPDLMVTDPPYGVEYDPKWRVAGGLNGPKAAHGLVKNDDTHDWRKAWELFPGSVAYVWHASVYTTEVHGSLAACSFVDRALIIWGKSRMVIGRGHYHHQHEPCWYVVREGKTAGWVGGRKQTTLWEIDKPQKSETGHSTQKPVECMERPIRNNSRTGSYVYEPFSGSGTTIIAAEKTGRRCLAIELSPDFVDIAVLRWAAFTGKIPILDATGESYEQAAKARHEKKTKAKKAV